MKEKLQKRLQELENLQKQALANFNALEGARLECQNLIKELEKEENEKKAEEELLNLPS